LLARKGFSYPTLAKKLCAIGSQESVRGAESKIQRGSYQFAFFLQVLTAVESEYPQRWRPFIETDDAWETAATRVLLHELDVHALDIRTLEERLLELSVLAEGNSIGAQISSGQFPFTLILQLSLVAPIEGLSRFVDQLDIERTAAIL
jgi:hypothetical protein